MLKKSVFMKKYFLDEKHAFISRAIELIALSAHKIRFIAKKVSLGYYLDLLCLCQCSSKNFLAKSIDNFIYFLKNYQLP